MTTTLRQLATLVEGNLIGDPDLVCTGANPPTESGSDDITMLDDPERPQAVAASDAMAVVTSAAIDDQRAQLVVDDPHQAFAQIVSHFRPPISTTVPGVGIDPSATVDSTAIVHPSAIVGAEATIGPRTLVMPGVVILGRCQVGADCVLHPGVTLYPYTTLEDRVVIHAGCILGANGFGYRVESGRHVPTAQLGYVHVESDVEIGAAVTIDRGTYGATRIGEGTKIDNQVMIAHNCQIGKHNLLCSQVGIAGSCRTGDYVILAGQVGLKDHITLADNVIVGAQAGVMDDCEANQVYLGSPATVQREQMQIMAAERRLPEMRKQMKKLRREVDQLQQQLASTEAPNPRSDQRAA